MITLSELRTRDLFTFFNLAEGERSQTEQGLVKIWLKPGGFQQYIDIELLVRPEDDMLLEAHLILDRTFVGGRENINPFAKDIAKSFIHDLLTTEEQQVASQLVNAIWYLEGTKNHVVHIRPPSNIVIDSNIRSCLDTYIGERQSHMIVLSESQIHLMNETVHDGRRLLHILVKSV